MPYDAMLAKADEAFNKNGWQDTNELFGVHVENLDKVPTSEWLILLMHVLMMEYATLLEQQQHAHCDCLVWFHLKLTREPDLPCLRYMSVICLPRRWRMRWGLKECLLALKRHPLASAASGDPSAYHEAFCKSRGHRFTGGYPTSKQPLRLWP